MRFLSLLLVIIIAMGSANAVGMGISTQTVYFKDVLRGGYAEAVITASNPNAYDVAIDVVIDGDIASWATVEPLPPNIIIPADSNGDFKVLIRPPPFIQNGVYSGSIIVLTGAPAGGEATGSGASLIAGAAVEVFVEVSDTEVKSISLKKLIIDPAEECEPIVFRISTKNNGNVELIPTYTAKLYNSDKSLMLKEEKVSFALLKPTVLRTDYLLFNSSLEQFKCVPIGTYKAEITGDVDGEVFYSGSGNAQVVERGTIVIQGSLDDVRHPIKAFMGEPVKIIALFNNSGVISQEAQLKIEAYKGDKLLTVVSGDKMRAEPESITTLSTIFVPSEIGLYKLVSSVNFGGKASNVVETNLLVEFGMTMMVILAAVPVIIVVVVAAIMYKRNQRGY